MISRKALETATATLTVIPTPTCTSWVQVAAPEPGQNNSLNAVEFAGANDGWTVGQWNPVTGGPIRTLTEPWDGTAWSIVSSP